MLKKTLLLGSTALALVAFVVPASASASGMFLHEGAAITTPKTVTFTGSIGFKANGSGFMCHAHATASFNTNNGTITGLEITECAGDGNFAGCSVEASSESNPTLTPTTHEGEGGENKGDIDISNVLIYNEYAGAQCPLVEATVTDDPSGTVTATPNNANAISSITLGGSVVVDLNIKGVGTVPVTAEATGELEAVGGTAETIGIAL